MAKNTQRVLITLPSHLMDAMAKHAKSRSLTKSMFVQLLVERELKQEGVIE